jgi:hypothetical protein
MKGHKEARVDACVDRSLVCDDPVLFHIWVENESVLPHLSVWVGLLGSILFIFLIHTTRTRLDMCCLFGSARWRFP